MSSITIRNSDESVKDSGVLRASSHGCAMELEVGQTLQQTVASGQSKEVSFAERVNRRFTGMNFASLALTARRQK